MGSDGQCKQYARTDLLHKQREILRKKQNEILEVKNTIPKMKSALVELISRLDRAE